MPIELRILTEKKDTLVEFSNDSLVQMYSLLLAEKPLDIQFDPSNKLLKQVADVRQLARVPDELPSEYALFQNYPNPFNTGTLIRYDTPLDGVVTLKLYNLLGPEIATLVNERQSGGRHEVHFDGPVLTSGV